MNYRSLGKTGLRVSELGMGCSGIGRTLYRRDDSGAIATLRASLDQGVNLFDTAPNYSAGESERLIGEALKGKRDQVILTSKVGARGTAVGRLAKQYKYLLRPARFLFEPILRAAARQYRHSQRQIDYSESFIINSLEQSLGRLQTDYLDIFLLYHPTAQSLREAEFCETLNNLKAAGKIRHWGISVDTLEQAMMCLEIPDVAVVQLDLSMVSSEPAHEFLTYARQKNVGVVARKVLAQGLLTGSTAQTKADRWVADKEQLQAMRLKANKLAFLATGGRTLTQAALLHIRGLPSVASAVVGYSGQEHLREVMAAYGLPLLTEDECAKIGAL